MTTIQFTIYGQPVGKGRPRFARHGAFVTAYTPSKTRAYELNVHAQAFQYKPPIPWSDPIYLKLRFYFAIPKSLTKAKRIQAQFETLVVTTKPDIENLIKCATDPLNTVFWCDDKQIVSVEAVKYYSLTPRTEYRIQRRET